MAVKMRRRSMVSVLLLIICATALSLGQVQLGRGPQIFDLPAPTLKHVVPLKNMIGRGRPIPRIGGVQFDQVAKPSKSMEIRSIDLTYLPDQQDGRRLGVSINGESVIAELPDWQLIPIARFADSPWLACVTLFGQLEDKEKTVEMLKSGGEIINYHPAMVNTLLGLRLAHLDMLILDAECTNLPYRLDTEPLPEFPTAWRAMERINKLVTSKGRQVYDSYVVCDHEQEIEFYVPQYGRRQLRFKGDLVYCLIKKNHRKSAPPNSAIFLQRHSKAINSKRQQLRAINPAVWDAGTNTMQYSAFFRYCKKSFPKQWREFTHQITDIEPEPVVQTPTVILRDGLAAIRSERVHVR